MALSTVVEHFAVDKVKVVCLHQICLLFKMHQFTHVLWLIFKRTATRFDRSVLTSNYLVVLALFYKL